MSDDDMTAAIVGQHGNRDFPCERSFILPMNILGSQLNDASCENFLHRTQGGKRRADDNIHVLNISDQSYHLSNGGLSLITGLEHLPIPCNNVLSTDLLGLVLPGLT